MSSHQTNLGGTMKQQESVTNDKKRWAWDIRSECVGPFSFLVPWPTFQWRVHKSLFYNAYKTCGPIAPHKFYPEHCWLALMIKGFILQIKLEFIFETGQQKQTTEHTWHLPWNLSNYNWIIIIKRVFQIHTALHLTEVYWRQALDEQNLKSIDSWDDVRKAQVGG